MKVGPTSGYPQAVHSTMQPMGGDAPRPCERQCRSCGLWKHHSRFRSQQRRHGSVSTVTFRPDCKDCELIQRNERKNEDRPRAIIESRAGSHARQAGATREFFMVNMNYEALVPVLRAMMSPEGRCLCCGHEFLGERDIQVEHREPPRHRQDWARLHARNLGLACASCNGGKTNKPYSEWLDDQELERLTNERDRERTDDPVDYRRPEQASLFD
jgi:hypothetical protein